MKKLLLINIKDVLKGKNEDKGFTLVEILIVLSTITILASVIVPCLAGYKETVRAVACDINCTRLKSNYEAYLIVENTEHSEAVFEQYLKKYDEDTCPDCGDIRYWDGEVQCLVHSIDGDSEGENDGGNDETVPFL